MDYKKCGSILLGNIFLQIILFDCILSSLHVPNWIYQHKLHLIIVDQLLHGSFPPYFIFLLVGCAIFAHAKSG